MRSFEKFVEFNQSHSFQMLKMLIDFFIRKTFSMAKINLTCRANLVFSNKVRDKSQSFYPSDYFSLNII